MKNSVKAHIAPLFGFIALVAIMGLGFIGCGGDEEEGEKTLTVKIVNCLNLKTDGTNSGYSSTITKVTFSASGKDFLSEDTNIAVGGEQSFSVTVNSKEDNIWVRATLSPTIDISNPPSSGTGPNMILKYSYIEKGGLANTTLYAQIDSYTSSNGNSVSSPSFGTTDPRGSGNGGTDPAVTTTSLPNGTVGTAYSQTLTATGSTPITWSIDTGSLPNGLTLSTAGVISGTPATANTFNFTVKATNATGNGTKALSIVIATSGGGGTDVLNGTTWRATNSEGTHTFVITLNSPNFTMQDTYHSTGQTSTTNGTYTLSGSTVTLTFDDSEGNTITMTGTISGNTASFVGWPTFTKQGSGGGGNGTFTLTGIPSTHNGKYAYLNVSGSGSAGIYGWESISSTTGMITLSPISNGSVSLPLWNGGEEGGRYSGNHTGAVSVVLFNAQVVDPSDISSAIGYIYFSNITFANGSATRAWSAGQYTTQ